MQTIEYRTIDKSSWPRGPWDGEPDKKQWQDPATGLPCLAKRHPELGHWCGYVGVDESHPSHGKHYDALLDIDTHGGLTYADACEPGADEAHGICHKPDAGEPDHVWWFGFDCGHLADISPGIKASRARRDGVYRDLTYVEREVTELARQLHALASPAPARRRSERDGAAVTAQVSPDALRVADAITGALLGGRNGPVQLSSEERGGGWFAEVGCVARASGWLVRLNSVECMDADIDMSPDEAESLAAVLLAFAAYLRTKEAGQ